MSKINKDYIISHLGSLKARINDMVGELNQLQTDVARFTRDLESERK